MQFDRKLECEGSILCKRTPYGFVELYIKNGEHSQAVKCFKRCENLFESLCILPWKALVGYKAARSSIARRNTHSISRLPYLLLFPIPLQDFLFFFFFFLLWNLFSYIRFHCLEIACSLWLKLSLLSMLISNPISAINIVKFFRLFNMDVHNFSYFVTSIYTNFSESKKCAWKTLHVLGEINFGMIRKSFLFRAESRRHYFLSIES